MKPRKEKRILAVSVGWQSFGFAMFLGAHELVDWGTRNFRHEVNAVKIPLEPKLKLLLDQYRPDVLVLIKPTTAKRERTTAKITELAKARRIPVVIVSSIQVQKAFAPRNQNKYHVAATLGERYPELLPQLPAPRKSWQSEKFGITIFEAAAAACVYYRQTIAPSFPWDKNLSAGPRSRYSRNERP